MDAIRTDASFVCWSTIQQYRQYADPYGAIIHIQDASHGGDKTLCGICTNGWQFQIHNDYSNVGCKRCRAIYGKTSRNNLSSESQKAHNFRGG